MLFIEFMFFLSFPKLYQNCAIFQIERDPAPFPMNWKKSRCVVKHYAPGGNKVQKAIYSFKVKVKVTRSLTLVSFERVS